VNLLQLRALRFPSVEPTKKISLRT